MAILTVESSVKLYRKHEDFLKFSSIAEFQKKVFYYNDRRSRSSFKVPPVSASKSVDIIGELESDVLEVLKLKGQATAADVMETLKENREIAYTTVSTTLDRLVQKTAR